MSPLRSQLLQTALAYMDAHDKLDVDAIMALCTPSCIHRIGPPPVKSPDRSNSEYQSFMTQVAGMMTHHSARLTDGYDPIVDDEARKVVMFLTAVTEAPGAGSSANQFVLTLKMNDEGTLVDEQTEHVDSWTMLEWIGRVGEAAKKIMEEKSVS